jgi:hypothetical protein
MGTFPSPGWSSDWISGKIGVGGTIMGFENEGLSVHVGESGRVLSLIASGREDSSD